MKNRLFRYISFLMVTAMFFVASCQKTDIEQANDEYNFNKIVPVVQGITGPSNATQTFSENYSASYYRGGSTWSWSAVGATITSTSEDTRTVQLTFTSFGEATVTVTETTMGGITSDPFDKVIAVAEFCPMTRDDFLGTWTGTEAGSTASDLTITFIAGSAANEIVAKATAGIPAFLGGVFTGWGEVFQADYEPVGDISIFVNANGSLSIPWTYWGQTLPGPYDYWYWGNGTMVWSGCGAAPTLRFDINLDYNGNAGSPSSNRKNTVSLTKQ
ncbi:MAG: hypothetical protein E4G95_00405 [Bacteroidia bacterium]|nr:MAG: hypothetical protein E4G95_00405 [Bacteroidia bacterium]